MREQGMRQCHGVTSPTVRLSNYCAICEQITRRPDWLSSAIIEILCDYRSCHATDGAREDAFRDGIDPVDLHMTISAVCFHNASNRYTFGIIFKCDMTSPAALQARRAIVVDTILAAVHPQ